MDKKIFSVYLGKVDVPNNEAYATLELPASPWKVQVALDKVRLQEGEELYLELEDYYGFEYLAAHFDAQIIGLNELNDLAKRLAALDEVQAIGFKGILQLKIQERIRENSGIITMQDLRDCAETAKWNDYHIVDAGDDAALGRFYAENDFLPELNSISDQAFELLDFSKIGKKMRVEEKGTFINGCYVLLAGAMQTAPPCPRELPPKPDYLFRLTIGLHPDFGGDRQVTLTLPATEAELEAAQVELGTMYWENTVLLDYDGIIPNAADFSDLPSELEAFNEFARAVRDTPYPEKQILKLKALLEYFEVQDLDTAMYLATHPEEYILTPELSSPREVAIDQLRFMLDEHSAELLISYVDLYRYGKAVIQDDNATLTPYGLLHREDYQPMLMPFQPSQETEMNLK